MAIKVASWNVEGRLHGYQKQGRGAAAHIVRGIEALDADVLVLPEFYMDRLAPGVENTLKSLGYKIFETAYKDAARNAAEHERWGEMHIGVLSRLPVSHMEVIRPGDVRDLLVCHVVDPGSGKTVRFIATHLDDRAEAVRVKQAEKLVEIVNGTHMPTVMVGDFNAMWRVGRARLLHSWLARAGTKILPNAELRSMAARVYRMASGTALALFASRTQLRDADPRGRATATPKMRFTPYLPSIRLIQIDHMLVSPEVSVRDFTVHPDGGSDHRAISAILTVTSHKP